MTDNDLLGPAACEALAEAIHGGPALTGATVRAVFSRLELVCPVQVVAVQGLRGPVERLRGWRVLALHPGIWYGLAPAAMSLRIVRAWVQKRRGLLGEAQPCTQPGQLVRCIQRAIVSLRRRDLGEPRDERSPGVWRELEERTRRALCDGPPGWRDQVRAYLDEVFLGRYQLEINKIRRAVVQWVVGCTRPYALQSTGLNYAFARMLRHGGSIYVLSDLRRHWEADLMDLGLCLQSGLVDSQRYEQLSPLVARAWDVMQGSYAEPCSLAWLARRAGCSPAHLSRRFKAELGLTPGVALTKVRLQAARARLVERDDSILQVALAVGFASVEHFHRTFKRYYLETPAAWRRRQQV